MLQLFSGIYFEKELSRSLLLDALHRAVDEGAQSLWVTLCDGGAVTIDDIPDIARDFQVPLLGVAMPGFIVETSAFYQGFMVIGFCQRLQAAVITDLSRGRNHVEAQLQGSIEGDSSRGSLMVIVDGLSSGIESLVRSLYDLFGVDKPVIGGGAGYPDFRRSGCIADAHGVYSDAAAILSLPITIAMSARHGWQEVEGPFLVTHAEGNVIHRLNYQPAYDVYSEVLQQKLQVQIDRNNFAAMAGAFPFGVRQLDSEFLVRDPVAVRGNSLECVGDVPEHSLVYLLTARNEQLIEAAETSMEALVPQLFSGYFTGSGEHQFRHLFMVDCISRALFLGASFEEELRRVHQPLPNSAKLVGMLTLGEIASSQQGTVNFLNKTVVIGGAKC